MSFFQKQYSSFHLLPNTKKEMVTVIPRELLKKDDFIELFDARNEIPLIGYLTNLLLNKKNDQYQRENGIEIKKSSLRNFLRRKCHSENKEILNQVLDTWLLKIKNMKNKIFHVFSISEKVIDFSFDKKYLKSLEKNTVSFNLFDLTKTRGIKAKQIFLRILAFDMRDSSERFFTLVNISRYLNLDCFNKRKNTIKMIKNAFNSLSKRLLITDINYIGINKKEINKNYRFTYKLGTLRQEIQK